MLSSFTQGNSWNSFMQDNVPCHKAKTVKFSWKGGNGCYEVSTTKPRYKSYRECIEIIREKVQNRNPQNIEDLWGFLQEE